MTCVFFVLGGKSIVPLLLGQNIADHVGGLVASGAWAELAREKAAALQGMSTTLTAYSQLLESAAPPSNGTARILSQAMR